MQRDGMNAALRQAKVPRAMLLRTARLLGVQARYAKAVLCAPDGSISQDGERLLALLAIEARLHRHDFVGDAERRLFDLGAQHIVRLLMDWAGVDSAQLARVQKRLNSETE